MRALVDDRVVADDGQVAGGAEIPVEAHLAGVHPEGDRQGPALRTGRGELDDDAGRTVASRPRERVAAELPEQPDAHAHAGHVHVDHPGGRTDGRAEHLCQPGGIDLVGAPGNVVVHLEVHARA